MACLVFPIAQSRRTEFDSAAATALFGLRWNTLGSVIGPQAGGESAAPFVGPESETLRRMYRVTAYCDRGITASGVPAGVGQCAAPADIPFGAHIYVPALDRTFVVTDRTAPRFRHNTVDLFIPAREACLKFGCAYLECQVIFPTIEPRYASARLATLVREHGRAFRSFQ
jgi:3D (Asp-Asp-Asp) domain-containing protein